jgi:hypothetical protein
VVQLSREKWGNSVDQHCAKELRLQINYVSLYSDGASSAGQFANTVNLHIENKELRKDSNPS